MKRFLALMVIGGLMVPVVGLAGDLDGKTFEVKVKDPGKDEPDSDTLEFKDGKFFSAGCEQYGFGWTEYTTNVVDSEVRVLVIAESEKEGTSVWALVVDGDAIKGKMDWTKEGQDDITYTVEGTAKK